MKAFYSMEEIQRYFNRENNTYEFIEDGKPMDVDLVFDFVPEDGKKMASIVAGNIEARNITTRYITAGDIRARNIDAKIITAGDIDANDLGVWGKTYVRSIVARNIVARLVNVQNITADSIEAREISVKKALCAKEVTADVITAKRIVRKVDGKSN